MWFLAIPSERRAKGDRDRQSYFENKLYFNYCGILDIGCYYLYIWYDDNLWYVYRYESYDTAYKVVTQAQLDEMVLALGGFMHYYY